MPTLLAIILLVVVLEIVGRIPSDTWITILIVAGIIVSGLACWFALAYLVRWFLKIALKYKD